MERARARETQLECDLRERKAPIRQEVERVVEPDLVGERLERCAGGAEPTLSAPFALRWALVKDARLFRAMERRLVRAIWRW